MKFIDGIVDIYKSVNPDKFIDDEGYNYNGYDRDGYNRDGFNKHGLNRRFFDKEGRY